MNEKEATPTGAMSAIAAMGQMIENVRALAAAIDSLVEVLNKTRECLSGPRPNLVGADKNIVHVRDTLTGALSALRASLPN